MSMEVLSASLLSAQQDTRIIAGQVRTMDGFPISAANVFLLGTLEGAISDSLGNFRFGTQRAGVLTLVVRRIGFREARIVVPEGDQTRLTVVLSSTSAAMTPVTIRAGRYTAGNERGATLTPLEVLTTAGSAADVNRTIQTLPGVQAVDEGTGLYVRGGDYTETRTYLDNIAILNPIQLLLPIGTFVGTVDPFLVESITFLSGGFGARYGNALSGIVSLETRPPPTKQEAMATTALGGISASGALSLTQHVGLRGAFNLLDLGPFVRMNGSPRSFSPPPHGHDISGSMDWIYRPSGSLRLFAIDQRNRYAVLSGPAGSQRPYHDRIHTPLVIASWRDAIGLLAGSASIGWGRFTRDELFDTYALQSNLESRQAFVQVSAPIAQGIELRVGSEVERTLSMFEGSTPGVDGENRIRVAGDDRSSTRIGAFAESEIGLWQRSQIVVGLRSDRSDASHVWTVDPRASATFSLGSALSLTAAAGVYHQVPDPLMYALEAGVARLPPGRATHITAGAELKTDFATVRTELYEKRYTQLAQYDRSYAVAGAGTGTSKGADFLLRIVGPGGFVTRLTYSLLKANRTEPNTGTVAAPSFDVRNTVVLVAGRTWPQGVTASMTVRYASGRPYTPIVSAAFDSVTARWQPVFGPPSSDRLPVYARTDLAVSYVHRVASNWRGVAFVTLCNVFNRVNTHEYTYSTDYHEREPVRALFNRSVYFGYSITFAR
jgi:vitamin B12 transporter